MGLCENILLRSGEMVKRNVIKINRLLSRISSRNFVKSVAFFGVAVYLIRDLAANDLMPME